MRDFQGDQAGEIMIDFLDHNELPTAQVSTGLQKVAEWWYYDSITVVTPGTRKIKYSFAGIAYFDFLHMIAVLTTQTGISERDDIIRKFRLEQNYPNPFNPRTVISWQVGATSKSPVQVDLSIYNVLGQKVATLVSEKQTAGRHRIEWDAQHFAAGIYYYRLQAGAYSKVRKMVLIK